MTTMMTVLVGLFVMAASIPLAMEKIGPNRWYGFRTPRVREDERVWYPVNRMTGRNGIVFALILWASALVGSLGLLSASTVGTLLSVVALAGVVSTFVSAAKIVKQVDAGGAKIDYRSSFEQNRSRDATKARSKLLDKLK